jgi:hypothetical protein
MNLLERTGKRKLNNYCPLSKFIFDLSLLICYIHDVIHQKEKNNDNNNKNIEKIYSYADSSL